MTGVCGRESMDVRRILARPFGYDFRRPLEGNVQSLADRLHHVTDGHPVVG